MVFNCMPDSKIFIYIFNYGLTPNVNISIFQVPSSLCSFFKPLYFSTPKHLIFSTPSISFFQLQVFLFFQLQVFLFFNSKHIYFSTPSISISQLQANPFFNSKHLYSSTPHMSILQLQGHPSNYSTSGFLQNDKCQKQLLFTAKNISLYTGLGNTCFSNFLIKTSTFESGHGNINVSVAELHLRHIYSALQVSFQSCASIGGRVQSMSNTTKNKSDSFNNRL